MTRQPDERQPVGVGSSLRRLEDERLVTGGGRYVDDLGHGALEVAFVRSTQAHARILDVDVTRVLDMEGVLAVYTWEDLPAPTDAPLPVSMPHPGLVAPRTQHALAREEVNHVGEAIAMVVAEDRYLAEDAAASIVVSYEPLPPCVGIESALRAEQLVHDDVPDNVAGLVQQGSDAVGDALVAAPRRLDLEFWIERSMASPLEGRGVFVHLDPSDDSIVVHSSTQVPHALRAVLASTLGCPTSQIEVVTPDVGGAFGVKGVRPWPEEVLLAWAARRLGGDVRWTEDRYEHFVASAHERAQKQCVSVGFDADGRVLAYDVEILHDVGAYTQYGLVVSQNTSSHVLGPYKVPCKRVRVRALYTNAVMIAPYRGAGRPEGVFALERTLDAIAAHLGLDRAEVRRRNLILPEEMPYPQGVRGQDGREVVYDSGDYPQSLDKLLRLVGWHDFEQLREQARLERRNVGIGLACYVENTGLGPYEGSTVTVHPDGTVVVTTGLTTHGQGHQTSFAQIVADELGVRPDDVQVRTGSTRFGLQSAGTYASRGAVVSGSAIALACRSVRAQALRLASEVLEAGEPDLELCDGAVKVRGSTTEGVPLGTLAVLGNGLKYSFDEATRSALAQVEAVPPPPPLVDGAVPGLSSTEYFAPAGSTFASGMHAAIEETDPQTAEVRILRYCVVHDCGTVVNPMIVEGQIHGGVAQGVGGALYERMVYDEAGQLLNASFMDFLMPFVTEVPPIDIDHVETPSPLNPLGLKGAGEAGVIPVSAVIASAIEDAEGFVIPRMPISPSELYEMRIAHATGAPGLDGTG